jgi:hypothetical protein
MPARGKPVLRTRTADAGCRNNRTRDNSVHWFFGLRQIINAKTMPETEQ